MYASHHPTIVLVVLALMLVLLLPTLPYVERLGWGYYPSGLIALVVITLAAVTLWKTPRDRRF